MKKIYIILGLVTSLLYSNNMAIVNTNNHITEVLIEGNGEACKVFIKSTGVLSKTNCVKITNSKKVKILCTKRKKICKTENEIKAFIGSNTSSSDYQYCLDNSMNNHEMRECNGKEFMHQDKRLNKYYEQVMNSFDSNEKTTLKRAQRAWIKYRDSKCEAEGEPMRGGSGEALLIGGCRAKTTRLRADELKSMIY